MRCVAAERELQQLLIDQEQEVIRKAEQHSLAVLACADKHAKLVQQRLFLRQQQENVQSAIEDRINQVKTVPYGNC